MKSYFLIFGSLLTCIGWSLPASGQPTTDSIATGRSLSGTDSIVVFEDPRLTEMVEEYDAYSHQHPELDGYRVEIFSSAGANSKLKAQNVRLKFLSEFPDEQAYLRWDYPNYEVRVGNYRTRWEAERALQRFQEAFPFAFVKKDRIDPPLLEQEKAPANE